MADAPQTQGQAAGAGMAQAYGDLGLARLTYHRGALASLGSTLDELAIEGDAVLLHAPAAPASLTEVIDAARAAVTARYPTTEVVAVAGPHDVVLDEATIDRAASDAGVPALVVSVGSGTISDLGKVLALRTGATLITVQTAASVNGYANGLSVLLERGIKRTSPSVMPKALIIDADVLDAAPLRLTRAGVGDAVAVLTSAADYYLAHKVGLDDTFDPWFFEPIQRVLTRLQAADGAHEDRRDALVEALTLGGLAIGAAGTTAPLSGTEHLLSHLVDMVAAAHDGAHDLHGAQVGAGTVLVSALWRRLLEDPDLLLATERLAPPDLGALEAQTQAVWREVDPTGALGRHCWGIVARKWQALGARLPILEQLRADWSSHAAQLEGWLGVPEQAAKTLQAWGGVTQFAALEPAVDADRVRWLLRALPFVRERLTVVDLLLLAGSWDEDVREAVRNDAAVSG